MANYTLRVIQNGQTKTAVLRDNQNGRIAAEPNTEYRLYNEKGELITYPVTERVDDDLWVFADGNKDGQPEFVLLDYFNKNPILNPEYVADAGNSLMTSDKLAAVVPVASTWVKAATVATAALIGGTIVALAHSNDDGKNNWRTDTNTNNNSNNNTTDTTINTPTITINDVADIKKSAIANEYTISGSLNNVDSDATAIVMVSLNGNAAQAATVNGNTWTLTVSGSELAANTGANVISATVSASDTSGNTATGNTVSDDFNVIDDVITVPTITISNVPDINQSSVANTYTLSGSLNNMDSDVNSTIVTVNINGTEKTATISSDKTSWTLDVSGSELAGTVGNDLTVTATVKVSDEAGNTASASASDTYNVTATLNAPSITVNSIEPITAANLSGQTTLSGSLNLNNDNLDSEKVTVTIGTQTYEAVIASDKKSWTVADVANSDLATTQGEIPVVATVAISKNGNTASASNTDNTASDNVKTLTVDTEITTPSITISDVADINQSSVANTYTLSGSLNNVDSDVNSTIVTVNINGTEKTATVSNDKTSWTLDVSGSELAGTVGNDLTVTATVKVSDEVGNTATASASDTYNVTATVLTPSISIDAITSDDLALFNRIYSYQSKTITGKLENLPTGTTPTVEVTVAGKSYTSTIVGDTWSVSVPKSDLTERGAKEIVAQLTVDGTSTRATSTFYVIDPSITIDSQTIHITSNNLSDTTTLTGTYDVEGADSRKVLVQIGKSSTSSSGLETVIKEFSSEDATNPVVLNEDNNTWSITVSNKDLAFAVGDVTTLQVGAKIEFTEGSQSGDAYTGLGYTSDVIATPSPFMVNLVDKEMPSTQLLISKTIDVSDKDSVSGSDDVADTFVFSQVLDGGIVTIGHFDVNQDRVQLNSEVFTSLSNTMSDFADYVQYNAATGALSYDADGAGTGTAVQFAQLDKDLAIEQSHFIIA